MTMYSSGQGNDGITVKDANWRVVKRGPITWSIDISGRKEWTGLEEGDRVVGPKGQVMFIATKKAMPAHIESDFEEGFDTSGLVGEEEELELD
jgi:hypothetical protein